MIRAAFDLAVIAILALYLALMGDHKDLPAGLIWRGGLLALDDTNGGAL